jgi:hypothetical protein
VYREREKKKGKERKNREKMKFFVIIFSKKKFPREKKKNTWHQGDRTGVPCHPGVRVPI